MNSPMNSLFDQSMMFGKMWMDFASKMASAAMNVQPASAPPDIARQMRDMLFSNMSQNTEQYLRSPQFLEMLKQQMDATISFREQINDALTRMHHQTQGVARQDVDNLMLSMRHMETRVLDRLEEITDRLDRITRKLSSLEAAPENGSESRTARQSR